jgi:outer membrane lipoprotein-sorting protein
LFLATVTKGHQLELAGEETIEGAVCYSLKLTKKSGDVEFHFFDKDALVPIMIRTTIRTGDAQGQFVETYMSEYQEVNGLMFPHALETKFNGQSQQKISIQSIVLNESYPDSMFTYPGK